MIPNHSDHEDSFMAGSSLSAAIGQAWEYASLFQHSLDAIFIADDEGRLLDVNQSGCDLLRAPREHLVGRLIGELGSAEVKLAHREKWREFLTSRAWRTEAVLRRADGSTFHGEVMARADFVSGKHVAIIRDISAHKDLEEQLRRSEERLHRAQRIAHIGSWEWQPESGEFFWSPECARLLGIEPSEKPTFEKFLSLVHPDEQAMVRQTMEEALRAVAPFALEYRIIDGDGRERLLHAESEVVRSGYRKMCGTVQDVTEKRAAEKALEKSELLCRQVLESLPVGVWVADERGNLAMVNSAGVRIWGEARFVGVEQFGEHTAWWVDTGKTISLEEWGVARAIRNREASQNELIEIQAFDGKRKMILNSAAPVLDPAGRVLGAFAINEDVTERRRLEQERERLVEALSIEQRWLQTVIERSPIGIILCRIRDHETPRFVANQRAKELLGVQIPATGALRVLQERLRKPDGSQMALEDLALQHALRGEIITGREKLVRRPAAADVSVLVNAAPIRNEAGEIIGAVTTYEDITHLKELEQLRQEWTSIVAHDLRQPVTTIATAATLLERSSSDPKVQARAERIGKSAQRLHRMIQDLTDLSRIEAHRIELEPVLTDIPALLGRVAEASDRPERVNISIRGEVPELYVDPQRMEQIVENLLSNAIKYSITGTPIEIVAERMNHEVIVSVHNQGPGISPEDVPTLFERFQRGRARGGAIKGLGLGLYIVRGLVEAQGGRVEVHSVPGQTTTFALTLPVTNGVQTPHRLI